MWRKLLGSATYGIVFLGFLSIASATKRIVCHEGCQYDQIQYAINAASDNDTVLVLDDDQPYNEDITLLGKQILLVSGYVSGNDTIIGEEPDSVIIQGTGNTSVVVCTTSETSSTVIKGFTIKDGSAAFGGGIRCSSASPTIVNCIVKGNSAG
jgi:hypothetical protein